MGNRYWALRLIALLNDIVGTIVLLGTAVGSIAALVASAGWLAGATLIAVLYLFAVGVGCIAAAELIRLAIDVAESAQQIAHDVRLITQPSVLPANGEITIQQNEHSASSTRAVTSSDFTKGKPALIEPRRPLVQVAWQELKPLWYMVLAVSVLVALLVVAKAITGR